MTNSSFMPRSDEGKAGLLEHLALLLPELAKILGLSDADMAQLKIDSVGFRYALKRLRLSESRLHNWTACKNQLRDGGTGNNDWPDSMTEDADLPPVPPPGVILRLSTMVASIKASKNYTEAIGQALRLIGTRHVVTADSWEPDLDIQNKAGHPALDWTKGDASALEIWADRGDGKGFVFFTISTKAGITDNTPLPASLTTWKYKAIYRLQDEQVGTWSKVLSFPAVTQLG